MALAKPLFGAAASFLKWRTQSALSTATSRQGQCGTWPLPRPWQSGLIMCMAVFLPTQQYNSL
jgi:hypothetical protein